ncbi:MAG: hypothetical protein JXB03_09700 [Spirochaetales bacterium]|nr:hypothetical protein [Spirochaetales bacterium]
MNILFDTHTFLWWTALPEKLPSTLCILLKDTEHTLFFSTSSSWEIAIKTSIGKLSLSESLETIMTDRERLPSA